MTQQKTVYFACSWFSEAEKEFMAQGQAQLAKNPTIDWKNSFRPLDYQFNHIDVDKQPEITADLFWQMGTFRSDLAGIDRSDLLCGMYFPKNPDTGMAFEYGYAYANHKPIVSVIPDDSQEAINLMLLPSVNHYITLSQLATFDFTNISFQPHRAQAL
ncbi:nucleoside 2-deoxyribosyltransferase [Bombilactobacillus folatiphilus]|uniref:Nucleoside 2-deoxyribosyltransferase n=1 Tax=Bombilactobacillus folatiphilus TaxID=2923362 RepID=A0ABY4P9X1_9LACO|nr:nucleoside 2-deoxyribosyltransferase [Bombilactobacillus folatiphilus]UQS82504.1 nucleoside 2-deoxyribosyltransferase [Bombilactobacillus folatiphilus]